MADYRGRIKRLRIILESNLDKNLDSLITLQTNNLNELMKICF